MVHQLKEQRKRVRAAMRTQAQNDGRFLGGRPPYGYALGDAGPHPNPAKAAAGQRQHRLEPDPIAAPIVARIFDEYVSGRGLWAIAEGLTRDGIPSPSAHDPARNRHRQRSQGAWSKSAVRAILNNPRYTGHQAWNRQRRDEILKDVDDVAAGHETVMRWNDRSEWVWSTDRTHESLISPEVFARAQEVARAGMHRPTEAKRRTTTTGRRFVLSGLSSAGCAGAEWSVTSPTAPATTAVASRPSTRSPNTSTTPRRSTSARRRSSLSSTVSLQITDVHDSVNQAIGILETRHRRAVEQERSIAGRVAQFIRFSVDVREAAGLEPKTTAGRTVFGIAAAFQAILVAVVARLILVLLGVGG